MIPLCASSFGGEMGKQRTEGKKSTGKHRVDASAVSKRVLR